MSPQLYRSTYISAEDDKQRSCFVCGKWIRVQKHSFQRKRRGMRGLSAALLWPTVACSDSLMCCVFSWEQQHVPAANLKILRGSDACRLGGRTTWKIYRMCAAFFCYCKDLVNVQIRCFPIKTGLKAEFKTTFQWQLCLEHIPSVIQHDSRKASHSFWFLALHFSKCGGTKRTWQKARKEGSTAGRWQEWQEQC